MMAPAAWRSHEGILIAVERPSVEIALFTDQFSRGGSVYSIGRSLYRVYLPR
jgi:hypothetical protein